MLFAKTCANGHSRAPPPSSGTSAGKLKLAHKFWPARVAAFSVNSPTALQYIADFGTLLGV